MVQKKQGKNVECLENLEQALKVNPNNKIVNERLKKQTVCSEGE
jgi:hypothetical protein